MKYSELNDKDRWAAIRAGVRAGYNSIDDIEKAYNEYADGGHLKQDDYYNNVLLQKDSNQKQYIKEQLEKRKTYADGGNTHKFGYGSNMYGYSENDDALTFYKDIDDIYVTPNGNYYQGEEFNKRKQQDIIADINNNPALLFRPEYSKWYNYYRTEAKKQGWDFDETMSTMFHRLPFESQEWIVQNNPGAFRLLPQNVQSDYITRTKGMRPGALQRLVDDAGENFLGKSVNNAVTAASLISLPTALKSGRLIKSGIDKAADVGYKALNNANVGRNVTNLMTKAVLPAVETKWGVEGVMNLPNDLRNVGKAINEGDYIGAGFEGVNAAFDASMIPIGVKNIPNLVSGVKNEVRSVVENVGKRVNPLGEPVVQEGFSNIKPKVRTKLGDVEIDNPNLFYRQGNGPLAQDLIESGIIRTKDVGNKQIVKGINLTKPTLEDAMFNKGHLAFDAESAMGKNLITTASSNKMIHTQPRTWTGDAVYVNNWKTNPITKQEANAYIFEPGYGYRKINTNEPSFISWEEANKH